MAKNLSHFGLITFLWRLLFFQWFSHNMFWNHHQGRVLSRSLLMGFQFVQILILLCVSCRLDTWGLKVCFCRNKSFRPCIRCFRPKLIVLRYFMYWAGRWGVGNEWLEIGVDSSEEFFVFLILKILYKISQTQLRISHTFIHFLHNVHLNFNLSNNKIYTLLGRYSLTIIRH